MKKEEYSTPEPVLLPHGLAAFAAVMRAFTICAALKMDNELETRRAERLAQQYEAAARSSSHWVVTDRATAAFVRHAAQVVQELAREDLQMDRENEDAPVVLAACDEVLKALAEGEENLGRAMLGEGASEEGLRRSIEKMKRINEEKRKQH